LVGQLDPYTDAAGPITMKGLKITKERRKINKIEISELQKWATEPMATKQVSL
jgi:hypothetical protein